MLVKDKKTQAFSREFEQKMSHSNANVPQFSLLAHNVFPQRNNKGAGSGVLLHKALSDLATKLRSPLFFIGTVLELFLSYLIWGCTTFPKVQRRIAPYCQNVIKDEFINATQ